MVLIKITEKKKVGIGRITKTRKDTFKKEKYKPRKYYTQGREICRQEFINRCIDKNVYRQVYK